MITAPVVARVDARYAVGRVLFTICAAIMTLHLVAVTVRILLRPGGGGPADVLSLLNAAQERSLASWWTSALLVTCCLVAVAVARLAGAETRTGLAKRPWMVLAVVFALLSIDEVVSLHERGAKWTEAGARYLWRHLAMAVEEAAEMVGVVIVLLGVLSAVRVRRSDSHLTVAYEDDN
ncbi:hypothetical protein E0H73_12985 [Kribbella pittospori]|uniref:Uncharacterized protein n=1 Tax=Kribbella pittospori TaxID=722689 RepID=A0A4R0KVS3_9ACTN|nr:hypothetical protein [Kribbella pittospori]TCC63356.1 hypothetical protein E0H73_12985 [Kribbella pittospori]